MSDVAAAWKALKGLKTVDPDQAMHLEQSVNKNLLQSHPGLFDTGVTWYGGKMSNYLHEVTKNDNSQYAISVMDPDELAKIIGRPNMDDPAVRDRVLTLYNRANADPNGLSTIVKLDGLVNEKGFVDVTRVTPGSQETAEVLRLLDRDRAPGFAPAKVPVLVQASGAKWATDPAPRLRYNGQTSGTLDMPRWNTRRPSAPAKTVADATSPTFYKDQPKDPVARDAKLLTFYDPQAALLHGNAVKHTQMPGSAFETFAIFAPKVETKIPKYLVNEAAEFQEIRRSRMYEYITPIKEQYGEDYLRRLAGPNNPYTMKLMGATGAQANDPIVLTRTERYGVVPLKEGEFSPALTFGKNEVGMHAGEPISAKSFQGNSLYHDYLLGKEEMARTRKGSSAYATAANAVSMFETHLKAARLELESIVKLVLPGKSMKDLEGTLFDVVKEAQVDWAATRKPGDRIAIYKDADGTQFVEEALRKKLGMPKDPNSTSNSMETLARVLKQFAGIADTMGTKTRPFILKNANKPLFLVDVGNFKPGTVLSQLQQLPEFEEAARALARSPSKGIEVKIQKLIESKGYDHVIYMNTSSEGSTTSKYSGYGLDSSDTREGYSPSFMIWREDQIVPLDDPKLFPNRGDDKLKKALALLVAPGAATTDKDNGQTD